jgi:hypothetical protein
MLCSIPPLPALPAPDPNMGSAAVDLGHTDDDALERMHPDHRDRLTRLLFLRSSSPDKR